MPSLYDGVQTHYSEDNQGDEHGAGQRGKPTRCAVKPGAIPSDVSSLLTPWSCNNW